MSTIEKIKAIDIRNIIEKETSSTFLKNNILNKCPFCGSGKGENHSPAFSVNVKENYYKCFSCSSCGSAIDFIINKNLGWKERHVIKYLEDKYLGGTEMPPPVENTLSAFQKTLYAISLNSIQSATRYLLKRKIQIEKLPENAYFYDKHYKALVFVDSENQLINRRIIAPQNGQSKANNQGKLNNSIYDKLFNPVSEVVYFHEGIINALSMPEYSSIALFSTENKIKNPGMLQKFTKDKHVVLAFDNDKAGDSCAEYYKQFLLTNRFDIKSLRRLKLPINKDLNDLLMDGELENTLKDKSCYELLWEDILIKPIPKESKNKGKDNDEYFFFVEEGCYFMKEITKGKPVKKKLSNFLMDSIYHLMDGIGLASFP